MSSTEVQNLDFSTYKEWVGSHEGLIIFHKSLCPHCKVMNTVLTKVQAQMPDIVLAAVDSEAHPDIMQDAGVAHVPTLCAIKDGQVKDRQVGVFNPRETMAFYKKA